MSRYLRFGADLVWAVVAGAVWAVLAAYHHDITQLWAGHAESSQRCTRLETDTKELARRIDDMAARVEGGA